MCGIAGIISFKSKPVLAENLKRMTDSIAHRGPDGEGQWVNESGFVGFGHRRLSIIDLSDNAKQPMHYAEGRYTITFNGEIYNYIELKEQLLLKGYTFQSNSDTEVLLALYDCKKEKCLDDLDGMFAFAIWDNEEKKLFCARDRFGEKPFYFFRDNESLYFASEMKALFTIGIKKNVLPKRIYYYLKYKTEVNPLDVSETFFKDILQLEPGHYLTVDLEGNLQKKKYWEIDTNTNCDISFDEACSTFYSLLEKSIRLRLRSDVPVGSSLSGGIDSSTLVLLIDKMKSRGQVQKTFSARFKDFEKDEGRYIDIILKKAKDIDPYYTWPVGEDLLRDIDKLYFHQEEPFGSASIFAQWEVMKLAKEHNTTVLIDGQGADEILAGYKPFYSTYLNQLYKGFSGNYGKEKQKAFEFHQIKNNLSISAKLAMRYPDILQPASRVKKIFFPGTDGKHLPDHTGFTEQFRDHVKAFVPPVIIQNNDHLKRSQKLVMERLGFLSLLRYADRNSMAFSREVRVPFLSHELVNYSFTLPDSFKLYEGWTKYILRKSMEGVLPSEIAWRKDKIGYEPPQAKWLGSPAFADMINDSRAKLKKEKIVSAANSFSDWQCIMVSKLI